MLESSTLLLSLIWPERTRSAESHVPWGPLVSINSFTRPPSPFERRWVQIEVPTRLAPRNLPLFQCQALSNRITSNSCDQVSKSCGPRRLLGLSRTLRSVFDRSSQVKYRSTTLSAGRRVLLRMRKLRKARSPCTRLSVTPRIAVSTVFCRILVPRLRQEISCGSFTSRGSLLLTTIASAPKLYCDGGIRALEMFRPQNSFRSSNRRRLPDQQRSGF